MKNFRPQDERFENFGELVDAARTRYTLPFREACRMLKCHRSWINRYIRDHVPAIYVSNGKGSGKPNYAKILSRMVNGENEDGSYSNESIYFARADFVKYVFDNIVKCQKQSKMVYKSYFISTGRLTEYVCEMVKMLEELETRPTIKLYDQIDDLYLKYISDKKAASLIAKGYAYATKRMDAEFADVPLPDLDMSNWNAVHDMLGYGDVEETIYRRLFREGYIRVELSFPDRSGETKAKKVYYIEDPQPIEQKLDEEMIKRAVGDQLAEKYESIILRNDSFIMKEKAWLGFNELIGNEDFIY